MKRHLSTAIEKSLYLAFALTISLLVAPLEGLKAPPLTAQPYQAQSCPLYTFYDPYTDHIVLSPEMSRLMSLCKLSFDGTAGDLVRVSQQHWLRSGSKERWEIDELPSINREEFIDLFRALGVMEPLYASKKQYDYIVVLGASVPALKTRLALLVEDWQEGLRASQIELLCGERILNPQVESESIILAPNPYLPWKIPHGKLPVDEIEMAHWMVENVVWPAQMKEKIEIVEVQRPGSGPNGRPGSYDTLQAVRKRLQGIATAGKSCLIISSQPHAHYHFTQAQLHLADFLQLELRANKCPEDTKISVILDAIARWIHTEFTQRLRSPSSYTSDELPAHLRLRGKSTQP